MQKVLVLIIFLFGSLLSRSQQLLYRTLTQSTTTAYQQYMQVLGKAVPSASTGYVVSDWVGAVGFESPGGSTSKMVIKLDTSFLPQWKKPYSAAIPLPTGGILLLENDQIEKVTASGAQVWIKKISNPYTLNDGVQYGNKIRLVGNALSSTNVPFTTLTYYYSDGFTLLLDTNGNYISHKVFQSSLMNAFGTSSFRAPADFSKIKRDAQGNFYVYTTIQTKSGYGSNLSLAKFDTAFNPLWVKGFQQATAYLSIRDLDIQSNGRIIVSARTLTTNASGALYVSQLIKFDSQGTLITNKAFQTQTGISELCKKANGNYVVGLYTGDSLFMAECDTALNINWFNFTGKGSCAGGSVIRNNRLYSTWNLGSSKFITAHTINGLNCSSYSYTPTTNSPSLSLVSFSLTAVNATLSVSGTTGNVIASQPYVDSCKCAVYIPVLYNNVCVGNTASITVIGTSNLSWYGSATGGNFIKSGGTFTYSANSPTVYTVYAQDSVCVAPPYRTPVTIQVVAPPNLSLSIANSSICSGGSVVVTVTGANSYTWSNGLNSSNYQVLQPISTTIYTVTGFTAAQCSQSKTLQVAVIPTPTLTISPTGTLCSGYTNTVSASGASSYSWSNGTTASGFTLNPMLNSSYSYTVIGQNGSCTTFTTLTYTVQNTPTVLLTASSSTYCAGTSVSLAASGAATYSWSLGGTGAIKYLPLQFSGTVNVTGTTNGCSKTSSNSITVYPLPALQISAPSSVQCEGTVITLTATGATTYSWYNGTTSPTLAITVVPGFTSYVLSGSNGTCSLYTGYTLQGIIQPTLSITPSTTLICMGTPINLFANGAVNYTWSNGSQNNPLQYYPSATNSLSITGTDGPCTAYSTYTFTGLPSPTLSISGNTAICSGETITLQAQGAQSYLWQNGVLNNYVTFTPTTSASFSLTATGSNGCSTDSTVNFVVNTCAGVKEHPSSLIKIYPNPSQGHLIIETHPQLASNEFYLMGADGKVIERFTIPNTVVKDLSHLPCGVYFLINPTHGITAKIVRID